MENATDNSLISKIRSIGKAIVPYAVVLAIYACGGDSKDKVTAPNQVTGQVTNTGSVKTIEQLIEKELNLIANIGSNEREIVLSYNLPEEAKDVPIIWKYELSSNKLQNPLVNNFNPIIDNNNLTAKIVLDDDTYTNLLNKNIELKIYGEGKKDSKTVKLSSSAKYKVPLEKGMYLLPEGDIARITEVDSRNEQLLEIRIDGKTFRASLSRPYLVSHQ